MAEINFDNIPEQFRGLFVERDGRYDLDTQKISEFQKNADDVRRALSARDNEKKQAEELRKQLKDLQDQMAGIDPATALEATKRIEELEHAQLIAEKKFEEAADKKYQRQIADYQKQIEARDKIIADHEAHNQTIMSDLAEARITQQLVSALGEAGARPEAIPYIVQTMKGNWELDTETRQPMPFENINGGKDRVTMMGADGKPLTFKGHAVSFLQDNPWAALQSNGANSTHQGNRQTNGNVLTISRQEMRDNNRRYEHMKAEAESKGLSVQILD